MKPETAIDLVAQLVYLPGWRLEATDHTNRFEDSIVLHVYYPAVNTNREHAPDYTETIETYASFPLVIADVDEVGLMRLVIDSLLKVWEHETREALRVAPTMWAPFHPHKVDGMGRWGDTSADLMFGVA